MQPRADLSVVKAFLLPDWERRWFAPSGNLNPPVMLSTVPAAGLDVGVGIPIPTLPFSLTMNLPP